MSHLFLARNRFNLRGVTSTTEKNVEENAIDGASSTTVRSVRPRPSFQVRSRGGRPAAASTSSDATETTVEQSNDSNSDEKTEEKPLPTKPARYKQLIRNITYKIILC